MRKVTKSQLIALAKKHGKIKALMFPSNCGPSNTTWVKGCEVDVRVNEGTAFHFGHDGAPILFDSFIDSFKYFNCGAQLGRRVHYYIEEPVEQNDCDCEMCGAGYSKASCLVD